MCPSRRGAPSLALLLLLIACGGEKSPATPTPVCSFAIAPGSRSFASDGGSATVAVTTGAGCTWTASAAVSWIVVTAGGTGSGPGTVSYTVAANPSADLRSSSVAIAGQSHAVTQSGREATACTYVLSPNQAQFSKDAATAAFSVAAPTGCAWQAVSTAAWLTVAAGSTGTGSGSVSYSVARNLDALGRTGTIQVAGQTFTVTQQGDAGVCSYAVEPVTMTPCMSGGVVTASVRTDTGCPWTAASSAGWLTIDSGASGSGAGVVAMRFTDNYDAPREGIVMVRWPTPTAGQNIRVSQAGCTYGVSRDAIGVAASGGTATFDVVQQSIPLSCGGALQDRCVWTATSDVSWIVVTSSMPRTGDNPVSFNVSANSGAASRTGHITVRDKTVTVTQAGQ